MIGFKIKISNADLEFLHTKLKLTRFPISPDNCEWKAGTNHEFLKKLLLYWKDHFDWRTQEFELNRFPQFLEIIDNQKIHFLYSKGKGINNKPLLLVHGWPDSFWRFSKVIESLTEPDENGNAFDIVIPSIPGYGFSSIPTEEGVNLGKISGIFNELMINTLGYDSYYLCGGDWGSYICERIAVEHGSNVRALLLTNVPGHRTSEKPIDISDKEKELFDVRDIWRNSDGAYAAIMNTKPSTISVALNDSPLGLASWLVEKFRTWSDDFETYTFDQLLTNICIYWFTGTADSSSRLYYESAKELRELDVQRKLKKKIEVPTGFVIFPKDLSMPPLEFAERFFNVVSWKIKDSGGHFAAFEEPELLTSELRLFFSSW